MFLSLGISSKIQASQQDSLMSVIESIEIKGHKKTKDRIILRELTFKVGDTINPVNKNYHTERSRQQLLNLYLFNEVQITFENHKAVIYIKERWYIWPSPKLNHADRNFNQWWLSKDPERLTYGLDLEWYNFRGRNETLKFYFRSGYTKQAALLYQLPYFNKKQTWGAQLNAHYSRNKEVWVATESNKVQFLQANDLNLIERKSIELAFVHRKKILSYHRFYGGYRQIQVNDTVIKSNPNYLVASSLRQQEWYLGYLFTYDKRDFKGYPLKGRLFKASAEYGVFASAIRSNPFTLKMSYSEYTPISKRFFNSSLLTLRRMEMSFPAYNKLLALGYERDFIRGYELNVIDGLHFALAKTEFKYKLFDKKFPFVKGFRNYETIPIAMYLTAFSDVGKVVSHPLLLETLKDKGNTMVGEWQYGAGMGVNVVAYYDYCMRVEYSVNRFLFNRFYLQFVAAI